MEGASGGLDGAGGGDPAMARFLHFYTRWLPPSTFMEIMIEINNPIKGTRTTTTLGE